MKKLRLAACAASGLALLLAAACGSDQDARGFTAPGADASSAYDGGFGSLDGAAAVGRASGIVMLHAAAFPSFRLCFENYPELLPQPDSTAMPQANVVGVEVGSVVRIGALGRAPGQVYVIDQREVRTTPDPQARTCGALLQDEDFDVDRHYQLGGRIDTPLGVGQVDVLAITGCGGGSWLNDLGIASSDCSSWDPTRGSLQARTIRLVPSVVATTESLPVQVIHMAALLEASRAPDERIEVTFGALDASTAAPLEQTVASAPPLFDAATPTTLALDQTKPSTYGSHGFRITLTSALPASDAGFDAGGTTSFAVDQTLAEVQELSFPQTVPTTYYLSASNYVLLLLGDPRIKRALSDGGANPAYDPRRAVHLLAVPVKEEVEAGAEDASAPFDPDAGSIGDGG